MAVTKPKPPKKPKRPRLTAQQLDAIRLGPQVAAAKYSMAPDQWKRLVSQAHSKGFTVAGELQGGPDILKPRLHSALVAEATKNVTSAYAPLEAEQSAERSRIQALDDKRKRDDEYYRQWLNDRQTELETTSRAADQILTDNAHSIAADAAKQWADAQVQAGTPPPTPAGTSAGVATSKPTDSTALQSIAPAIGASADHIAAARTQGNVSLAAAANNLAFARQSSLAQGAALESKRMSDTWQALADNATGTEKLKLQKAADTIKELEGLKATEVSKAQTAQQNDLVAQKLGISQDALTQKTNEANRKYKLAVKTYKENKAKYDAAISHQEHQDMLADKKYNLDKQKFGAAKAKDNYQRKHKLGPYKPKSSDSGSPKTVSDGQRKTSQQAYQTVETIRAAINDYHRRKTDPKKIRGLLINKHGASSPAIDVAEDLRKNHGKLSPAGVRKAKALGILHPEKLWGTV